MKHTKEGNMLKAGDYIRWKDGYGDRPSSDDTPTEVTRVFTHASCPDRILFEVKGSTRKWLANGVGYTVVEKSETKWEDVEYGLPEDGLAWNTVSLVYAKGEFSRVHIPSGWTFRDRNTHRIISAEEFLSLDAPDPAPTVDPPQDAEVYATYTTGAKRERKVGKGAPTAMLCGFPHTLTELHKHMDNPLGRNWEKGLPLSSYVDATFRHLLEEVSGNGDDKSLISAIWNLMCYAETKHRISQGTIPEEMDDMDRTRYSEVKYGD
jgi:hypothetical protein